MSGRGALATVAGLMLSSAPVIAQTPAAAAAAAKPADDHWVEKLVDDEVRLGPDTWRVAMLAASSRRHETVSLRDGGRTLRAFVAWPDRSGKVPVVLMAPEDQGLNDWARLMADEIAAMGYIVVVPDLHSGLGPGGGGRESFKTLRDVFLMSGRLPKTGEPMLTAELNRWADYAQALPQANGKLAALGFAWGGGRMLYFAAQRRDVGAVYVFYDAAPPAEALSHLTAPLYGFYATFDPRVTRSLPATEATMAALGKTYEPVVYPGSDHMFVRLGQEPRNLNPANIAARNASLARLQDLLSKL